MFNRMVRRGWLMLVAGVAMGLLVGVGMMVGALVGARYASPAGLPDEIPLHAISTHGNDQMAIATGVIDDGMEGLVTLDYQTGELRVFVISNKAFKWVLKAKYNVLADLKIEKGKKPNFLLVTGGSNYIKGGAALQPALTTIYVCDANTGILAAYGLRYNRTAYAAATPSVMEFVPLDVETARSINLGDE